MSVLLAALCAVCYGAADFAGGFAARRSPVLAVLFSSQLSGALLALAFILVSGARLPAGRRPRLGRRGGSGRRGRARVPLPRHRAARAAGLALAIGGVALIGAR